MNIITSNYLIIIKTDKNFPIKKSLFFNFFSNHITTSQLILLKELKIKLKTSKINFVHFKLHIKFVYVKNILEIQLLSNYSIGKC